MQNDPLNSNPLDSKNLFAGIDHISLDKRDFNPSQEEIERTCKFFSIGKLKSYQKEKGTIFSHSNFLIFALTNQGQYALKFYDQHTTKRIKIEYYASRFLITHHFKTPVMHAGHNGNPYLSIAGRLATCFSYIDGQQAWQNLEQKNIINKITTAMFSLKKLLITTQGRIPFLKQESLAATLNTLAKTSKNLCAYKQKETISSLLKDTYQNFQRHPSLFSRQWIHNNTHLSNFLVQKDVVYTMDLSHIHEDYSLSDLTSLIVSCLFLGISKQITKTIINNYFSQHNMNSEHTIVLKTLTQSALIKEFLKNVTREQSIDPSLYPAELIRTYKSHLLARTKLILSFLEPKMFNQIL